LPKPASRRQSLDCGQPGIWRSKLSRVLTEELKFHYLIRFRGNIKVAATDGETRMAIDWVGQRGRARILRDAAVTAESHVVGAVVCVRAKDMKEPWCLATRLGDERAGILYTSRQATACPWVPSFCRFRNVAPSPSLAPRRCGRPSSEGKYGVPPQIEDPYSEVWLTTATFHHRHF
jgi:hypothetical protein